MLPLTKPAGQDNHTLLQCSPKPAQFLKTKAGYYLPVNIAIAVCAHC